MPRVNFRIPAMFPLCVAATCIAAGCGGNTGKDTTGNQAASPATGAADPDAREHGAWWCVEHGVPEAECSVCNSEVAKECQARGDWCQQHQRAESQCFLCNPDLAARFAARYEAKYGRQPPKPAD